MLALFKNLQWSTRYGISIDGRGLNHLRFAEDIIIFPETVKQLQDMLHTLERELKSRLKNERKQN